MLSDEEIARMMQCTIDALYKVEKKKKEIGEGELVTFMNCIVDELKKKYQAVKVGHASERIQENIHNETPKYGVFLGIESQKIKQRQEDLKKKGYHLDLDTGMTYRIDPETGETIWKG